MATKKQSKIETFDPTEGLDLSSLDLTGFNDLTMAQAQAQSKVKQAAFSPESALLVGQSVRNDGTIGKSALTGLRLYGNTVKGYKLEFSKVQSVEPKAVSADGKYTVRNGNMSKVGLKATIALGLDVLTEGLPDKAKILDKLVKSIPEGSERTLYSQDYLLYNGLWRESNKVPSTAQDGLPKVKGFSFSAGWNKQGRLILYFTFPKITQEGTAIETIPVAFATSKELLAIALLDPKHGLATRSKDDFERYAMFLAVKIGFENKADRHNRTGSTSTL